MRLRMESPIFEEMGREWADTAHTTELQPCFETVEEEFGGFVFFASLAPFRG